MTVVFVLALVLILAAVGVWFASGAVFEQADLDWCPDCDGPCTFDDDHREEWRNW